MKLVLLAKQEQLVKPVQQEKQEQQERQEQLAKLVQLVKPVQQEKQEQQERLEHGGRHTTQYKHTMEPSASLPSLLHLPPPSLPPPLRTAWECLYAHLPRGVCDIIVALARSELTCQVWIALENETLSSECHNPHIAFLLTYSQFSLYGDAELDVWRASNDSGVALIDWVAYVTASRSGWIRCSLMGLMPAAADNSSVTLSRILAGFSPRGPGTPRDPLGDQQTILTHLRNHGLGASRTQLELQRREEELEAAMSEQDLPESRVEELGREYEALQEELWRTRDGDDALEADLERLWWPLEDDPFRPLVEYLEIQKDGNFCMYACRSDVYMYLICFATS